MEKTEINSILSEFVGNSDEEKLKKIGLSFDLQELIEFYNCSNKDSLKSINAKKRIDTISPDILKEINDPVELFKLISKNSLRGLESFETDIITRITTLLSCKNSDQLLILHKNIFGGSVSDDGIQMLDFFENFIFKAVENDQRKSSFQFLLDVWKAMFKSRPNCVNVANLMPEALKNETDIKKLIKSDEETYNDWNGKKNEAHYFLWARIESLIFEYFSKTEDVEILDWYLRVSNKKETKSEIVKKMVVVANNELKKFSDIQSVFDYEELFSFDNFGDYNTCRDLRITFNSHVMRIVSDSLKKIKKAEDIYPLVLLLNSSHTKNDFYNSKRLIVNRWIVLSRSYFKKNLDLTIALDWFNQSKTLIEHDYMNGHDYVNSWVNILAKLIPISNNKKTLASISNISWLKELKTSAEERVLFIISNMKEPDEFFAESIKNNKFFGDKELFIKKAKEFVNN